MKKKRTVKDSMGELQVDEGVLYGAQTQRAVENFPVSGRKMPELFIRALIQIKKNAAVANKKLDCLDNMVADAVVAACEQLLVDDGLMSNFPVDVFQTGSGTSSNMNANEVIAAIATGILGESVDPNDHVNFGQSSNDVIPTAIHVSARFAVEKQLKPSLQHLVQVIETKADSLSSICKTGRTHLMDAMPVRMDQTLLGWAGQLRGVLNMLDSVSGSLRGIALGGTAVGTGINTHPDFSATFSSLLSTELGVEFKSGDNFFALMGAQDPAVALSGQLKSVAVVFMKIANDLRWMNSGPLAGLGEISLQALQPGSSIMPGKVNPVIPESVAMVAAEVIGNDATITIAGQSGNFELNVMLPVIADNLLVSVLLLSNSAHLLADKAISTFTVNEQQLKAALHKNPILVTALNPIIGYAQAAEIAKEAYRTNRAILDVAEENTEIPRAELEALLDPTKLTEGGL
jgi:fumarate hydratase class II